MTTDQTEEQADAAALLATVRHLMTGAEIDVCERIEAGASSDDPTFEETEDFFTGEVTYHDPGQFAGYPTSDEKPIFESLRLQF